MNLRLLPYTPERDVYRLLGVPPTASIDEIGFACRRLAVRFHPDRNGSDRATQEMQVVSVVRRVMTDPASRAQYDRERHRFHAAMTRPRHELLEPWTPVPPEMARPSPMGRYLRAALVGILALAAGLAPPRCRGCRIVIASEDAYCAACGTPLLTGG
ncbi:MAG: J domain-containing protein [Candidatus Limnocylindria bacterium]